MTKFLLEQLRSLSILHDVIQHLLILDSEIDIFVQGEVSDLIVAIGRTKRLIVRTPEKGNWEKVTKFMLENSDLGNYVVGYLGHGLHRITFNSSVRNSDYPDAYLVVPDSVIRIVDGHITEVVGNLSKYANLELPSTPIERDSVVDYPYYDTDLMAVDYMQKVAIVQEWIKERNQDDRITLSRQIRLNEDVSIFDQIVFSDEEEFSNPYNRIIYHKFFDEGHNLIEYGGISPELLVSGSELEIRTNKLSGTLPKAASMSEQKLWSDKKILDEHRESIKALVRKIRKITNDVTIEGPIMFELPTLFHLLSIITTRTQNKYQFLDIIRALVLTGATAGDEGYKKLCELEGVTRGAYYGLSILFGPNMKTYSCPQIIRCIFRYNNTVWTQVGGGISRLSNPENEFYETVYKAESILRNKK